MAALSTVNRRSFLLGTALGLQAGRAFSQGNRPNIVFILLDDLRWDALGCTGHPVQKTPNIDRIAAEGANFRNAFVATPLCSPSRASFLTGLYPHYHRVVNNDNHGMGEVSHALVTFPRILHEHGYDTAFIGKWHMGNDDTQRIGFDHWISFHGQGAYIDPLVNIDGRRKQLRGYMTDFLNESAVRYVEQKHEAPFALVLSHKAVHIPYLPAKRHEDLYSGVKYTPPELHPEDLKGKKIMGREVKGTKHWETLSATAEPAESRRGRSQEPAAVIQDQMRCLQSVDEGVGMILDALRRTGKLDETLVIFASDNGYLLGEHGQFDNKRWAYEPSIRIPLLMRYPRLIRAGIRPEAMVLNVDLAPTILDVAGVRWPDRMHGVSMAPALKDPNAKLRSSMLTEYFAERTGQRVPDWQSVRTERWKYIRYTSVPGADELYDLQADPDEVHNVIDRADLKPVVSELRRELEKLVKQTSTV